MSDTNADTPEPQTAEPRLAPPGAGVPAWQRWMMKPVVPLLPVVLPPARAARVARATKDAMVTRVRGMGPDATRRTLIAPMTMLEDSSRYWSGAMVLEHVALVADAGAELVRAMLDDEPAPFEASTSEVKPAGGMTVDESVAFLEEADRRWSGIASRVARLTRDERARAGGAPHPWFGVLDASRWIAFEALHRRVHAEQLARVARARAR
ncbi:MAG: hypothetical protein AAGH64_12020 [Planctomycetota bacterium]